MKTWQKILNVILIVTAAAVAFSLIRTDEKECRLCNSFRYHAPCLIDLETGEMVELALYDPHPTKTAELTEIQAETDTFSFIRLGNVTGIRLTSQRIIELSVPVTDRICTPPLCTECRRLLQGYDGRYILADLYDKEKRKLTPIAHAIQLCLRCYSITMYNDKEGQIITIIVQGILF